MLGSVSANKMFTHIHDARAPMTHPPTFCFALRPFSLGVTGLLVLAGRVHNGDHEAFALCTRRDGQSDAVRLEFTQVVDLDTVVNATQTEAQALMPDPRSPVVWIQTTHVAARKDELLGVAGAVDIALRSVKSPELRDILARVVAPRLAR